jgi:hypothetical protein
MRLLLGIAIALLAFASPALAVMLPVTNASFEAPDVSSGGATWTNDLAGWTQLPTAGDAFIEYISGLAQDPFASDGTQHLGVAQGAEVYQDTGLELVPNSEYTLSVDIGNRNDSFTVAGNESTIGLYVGNPASLGGTELGSASFNANFLADGTFAGPLVINYMSNGSPPSGNIFISLQSTGENRSHFDNVRFEGVPEPSTIGLVFMALLGVLKLRRK